MASKDHKNLLRRELGYQLGLWRIQRRQTLHQVAAANNIRPYVLDQIEMGMNVTWKHYHKILKYYNCNIKLVEKTTD